MESVTPGYHLECFSLPIYQTKLRSVCGALNTLTCDRVRLTPKRGVLDMTRNRILCCGSISGDLGSVNYLFIIITPMSTLTWSGCIHLNLIHLSNRYIWIFFIWDTTVPFTYNLFVLLPSSNADSRHSFDSLSTFVTIHHHFWLVLYEASIER